MEKYIEKMYSAPLTNRGVVNTSKGEKLSEYMLFDWLQFTILPIDKFFEDNIDINYTDEKTNYSIEVNSYSFVKFLFKYLFNVDSSEILNNVDSPVNGYELCYSYRDIKVMQAPSRNDMGTHIIISGSACRVIEDLNISYKELFSKLLKCNVKYTRIDVSYDVFHSRFFTMNKVENSIKNIEVLTKFRNSVQFTKDNLISSENIGKTIWFGSRTSDIQFVFYDKLKERKYNANSEVDQEIKFWNRLECRFKNDYANKIIYNYLFSEDFNGYMKSILNNYLSFRNKTVRDKNRSRWPLKSWWADFLDTTDKIQFQTRPIEYSITKKRSWLDKVAGRSQLAVLLSSISDLSIDFCTSDYLYSYFKNSIDKIKEKDIEVINEYRIKEGLQPVTYEDIKSYITDIKDIIISKNTQ